MSNNQNKCLVVMSPIHIQPRLTLFYTFLIVYIFSWKRYKLFVAAKAIMFSSGCQALCKIFRLKSKHSTLISSFFLLPVVVTFFCFNGCFGRAFSRVASKHRPALFSRLKIRKKLLYDPVKMELKNNKLKQFNAESLSKNCLGQSMALLAFL